MNLPSKVNCPTCANAVEWTPKNLYRPFCSKRCQLIDLGEWAEEGQAIPCGASKDAETIALPDIEDIEAMLSEQSENFFKE